MDLTIRRAGPGEWEQARRLRLEMLGDAPCSFSDRLAQVRSWDEARWRTRHASALLPDSVVYVAVDGDGAWLGQMCAREYLDHEPARVWLLEVYVTPVHRSSGLAERLLARVEAWVVDRGHTRLYLDVHEDAAAARRFYARAGFAETGRSQPHPLDPSQRELEMFKQLG